MTDTPAIVPEIVLINKMEEMENFLPGEHWEQLRSDALLLENETKTDNPVMQHHRRVFLRDFVNKAINLPLEIKPVVSDIINNNLYRLHLFCCQRAIHDTEVRRNPFILHFKALQEMHEALTGMFLTYRLTHPGAPYSWNKDFFEHHLIIDTASDGHPLIKMTFCKPEIIDEVITEELVTDWMLYRAYDNNGIKTLMDIKNNLLTLPDYQRGGTPASEFSRFERKLQEQRNRVEVHKNQELELEFRKTLVQNIAQEAVKQLINSGASSMDILQKAFNADLKSLIPENIAVQNAATNNQADAPLQLEDSHKKAKKKKKVVSDEYSVDNILAKFGK